ncbi:hypothetical protein AADZ84_09620 [Colwelliaceae bacterium MEBiC 14330]|jgi:hypothetical protein
MNELNVNEIEQVNGGSRMVRIFRWLAAEGFGNGAGNRYGAGGWRP